ncbi:MAG: glucose 1-dehydrogenase [Acidobacteria bacterium]|nr:glucose 1-dehydrogenase [Acidobacteriota bacterium]
MRLQDKVAIITGAAHGIGKAIAIRFAQEGAFVSLVDIDENAGQAVTEAINQSGSQALFVRANVGSPSDVTRIFDEVFKRFGSLDVLVNCAGISPTIPITETSNEDFDHLVHTNFRSVFLMTRGAIPLMRARGRGVIINMASVNGLVAAPGLAIYSATKAAIINFTQSTALELAKDKIRAVAICPASVDTPMLQNKFDASPDPDAAQKANIERHPIGRLATPEEIASLAVFLASDEAGFITGSAHLIDGGAAARRI